jgi:hypothetical protein
MKNDPSLEWLGRLFEDELSATDAEAFARELRAHPELKRDLRQHLVIWEFWAQQQTPERSADAFMAAWKTRMAADNEGADAFCESTRARLEALAQPRAVGSAGSPAIPAARQSEPVLSHVWKTIAHGLRWLCRRPRIAWGISMFTLALAGWLWFGVPWTAQAVVVIHGEAVCTACVLYESHEHAPAIRVTEGRSTKTYYLVQTPALKALQPRFCAGPCPAVATGTHVSKTGRLVFKTKTVELPAEPPQKEPPKKDERTLFPI